MLAARVGEELDEGADAFGVSVVAETARFWPPSAADPPGSVATPNGITGPSSASRSVRFATGQLRMYSARPLRNSSMLVASLVRGSFSATVLRRPNAVRTAATSRESGSTAPSSSTTTPSAPQTISSAVTVSPS